MRRRTLLTGTAGAFATTMILGGCSDDPVAEAQAKADRAVPGQLQVVEAHRGSWRWLGGDLYATYRSVEDQDSGFVAGHGFDKKSLRRDYLFARWRSVELRRIQDALAQVDRKVVAVDIDPNGNYYVGVGSWFVGVNVWLPSELAADFDEECRRLTRAMVAWHGPDLRIPTGPQQVGRSPDTTDVFHGAAVYFHLLPPDGADGLPALDPALPPLVALSDPGRRDAAKARSLHTTSSSLRRDGSVYPIAGRLQPDDSSASSTNISLAVIDAAKAFLGKEADRLSMGQYVSRYDGRLDRIRTYVALEPKDTGNTVPRFASEGYVALTVRLDGSGARELRRIRPEDDYVDVPFELDRLPRDER